MIFNHCAAKSSVLREDETYQRKPASTVCGAGAKRHLPNALAADAT